MWLRKYRVMQEAGADGGGSGGAPAAVEPEAGEQVPADAAPAAPPPATTDPQSLLKGGEQAPSPTATEFIPEKFQIKNEAGELDVEASARKMSESYAHLEKKNGSGEGAPKTADDYNVTPPESLKDLDVKSDPEMQEFLSKAQKAGISQAQLDVVMSEYFRMAPLLAAGGVALTQEAATADLKKSWATDADFKRNTHLAYSATSAAVERSGVSMDEVEKAGLGNNPVFLRLMASLGAEFQEDIAPGGTVHKSFGEEDVRQLETSEAYANPKHPDHERVSKQVKSWYDRKYGTEAAA